MKYKVLYEKPTFLELFGYETRVRPKPTSIHNIVLSKPLFKLENRGLPDVNQNLFRLREVDMYPLLEVKIVQDAFDAVSGCRRGLPVHIVDGSLLAAESVEDYISPNLDCMLDSLAFARLVTKMAYF